MATFQRFSVYLLLSLLLTGCESISERVRDRFAEVPPQTQVYDADVPAVNSAALLAFKRLDYNITQSKFGQIEAASRIRHSEVFADARQIVAQVQIRVVGPGKTEVAMLLTEDVETPSLGGPTQQALREHGFYGTYFATLQQVLKEEAAGAAGNKN
ncbi:MAG: hypothetical protein ACHQ5A_04095 [Opitutales bacterium]